MPQDPRWDKPPEVDLDEIFRKWRTNASSKFKFGNSRLLIIIIILWLLSGLYIVSPDEVGVEQRFGKFTKITDPGLHYRLPAPVDD